MPMKVGTVKAVVFHVWIWVLNHREAWALKIWSLRTVMLEKTLESPLDCKEIKPVNPKGNKHWMLIERTDAKAETPMLWLPDSKNWLIGKDLDVGKDCRQEEKGMTENEMVGWHHRLNGHEFEQALRDGKGQRNLVCCSPWGHKATSMTKRLSNNSNTSFLCYQRWPWLIFPLPTHFKSVGKKKLS